LIVSKRKTPEASVGCRPQPVNCGSALPRFSCGVGLPDLDERVGERRPAAVDYPAGDDDPLALGVGADEHPAEIAGVAVHLDAGIIGRRADMNVRAGRLRRRFAQAIEVLRHQLPSWRFSNMVERRPRRTMSYL
jgi:hypothetical protein